MSSDKINREPPDFRPLVTAVAGMPGGILTVMLANRKKPKRTPDPAA